MMSTVAVYLISLIVQFITMDMIKHDIFNVFLRKGYHLACDFPFRLN